MRILQTNFYGDPNLGLYVVGCDKFCIVGNELIGKDIKKIQEQLDVKVKKISVAGTSFVGLFLAANSNGILLPKVVNDIELALFRKISSELDVKLEMLNSKFSALGNLILCNDKGGIVSSLFDRAELERIRNCLDVEIVKTEIAGIQVVGSCGVATNKGCLLHRDADEDEIKLVESVLRVDIDIGTANFGSPFVGSCMVANSNGALVGDKTTSPEIQRIIETLKLE